MEIRKKNKLVCGVGINDADYEVQPIINGKRVMCPFYAKWVGMLERCYSEKFQNKWPTYIGCYVILDWIYFSNFKYWMQTQPWEGKHLDKDILFPGNKVYGPYTCVFVDQKVNMFLTDSGATRGQYPIGVYYHKESRKFSSVCSSVTTGKQKNFRSL